MVPAARRPAAAKQWGYIDRRGGMVIQPRFSLAHPFDSTLAQVEELEGPEFKPSEGYINRAGEYVWRRSQ